MVHFVRRIEAYQTAIPTMRLIIVSNKVSLTYLMFSSATKVKTYWISCKSQSNMVWIGIYICFDISGCSGNDECTGLTDTCISRQCTCGEGTVCFEITSDACESGSCRCGQQPECEEGMACLSGVCANGTKMVFIRYLENDPNLICLNMPHFCNFSYKSLAHFII